MAYYNPHLHKQIYVIRLHVGENGQSDYSESHYTFGNQSTTENLPDDLLWIVQNELMNNAPHIAVTIFSGKVITENTEHTDLLDSLNSFRFYYNPGKQKVFLTKEGVIAVVSNF